MNYTRLSLADVRSAIGDVARDAQLTFGAVDTALRHPPTSIWQRPPVLPAMFRWLLVRSQGPQSSGKFTAPERARPTTSEIPGDVIPRFVAQHHEAEEWMRNLDQRAASRAIMTFPFVSFITYSVLDGMRLLVAHDRRHFEQARRVMASPGFGAV